MLQKSVILQLFHDFTHPLIHFNNVGINSGNILSYNGIILRKIRWYRYLSGVNQKWIFLLFPYLCCMRKGGVIDGKKWLALRPFSITSRIVDFIPGGKWSFELIIIFLVIGSIISVCTHYFCIVPYFRR